jgi:hypothetical protein
MRTRLSRLPEAIAGDIGEKEEGRAEARARSSVIFSYLICFNCFSSRSGVCCLPDPDPVMIFLYMVFCLSRSYLHSNEVYFFIWISFEFILQKGSCPRD